MRTIYEQFSDENEVGGLSLIDYAARMISWLITREADKQLKIDELERKIENGAKFYIPDFDGVPLWNEGLFSGRKEAEHYSNDFSARRFVLVEIDDE